MKLTKYQVFLGMIGAFIMVVAIVSSLEPKSTPLPEKAQAAPNPAREAKCRELLQFAEHNGMIQNVSSSGEDGSVTVGRAFYAGTFHDKQLLDSTVRCVLSHGRADDQGISFIHYYDLYTNKEIASWSRYTGFSVD